MSLLVPGLLAAEFWRLWRERAFTDLAHLHNCDAELEVASTSGDRWDSWGSDGQASLVGLARLRTTNAAKVRRKRSPVGCAPCTAVKPAALLVVQRASDRAQQVQVCLHLRQ